MVTLHPFGEVLPLATERNLEMRPNHVRPLSGLPSRALPPQCRWSFFARRKANFSGSFAICAPSALLVSAQNAQEEKAPRTVPSCLRDSGKTRNSLEKTAANLFLQLL